MARIAEYIVLEGLANGKIMINNPLKVGVIGGFGGMLSHAAKHWQIDRNIKVVGVLDRGKDSDRHDKIRADWRQHSTRFVDSIQALCELNISINTMVICCGKNGDDLDILAQLAAFWTGNDPKTVIHMSTVSVGFVEKAESFLASFNIKYYNCPMTGGIQGAQEGQLILLLSGDCHTFDDRLRPMLKPLGHIRFCGFGKTDATGSKFLSHALAFSGFTTHLSALHAAKQFLGHRILSGGMTALFRDLNLGAGGNRQWDLSIKLALEDENYHEGFMVEHALIDALYTAQYMHQTTGMFSFALPSLIMAVAMAYLTKYSFQSILATQGIIKLLDDPEHAKRLLSWIDRIHEHQDLTHAIDIILSWVPDAIRHQASLNIKSQHFLNRYDRYKGLAYD